MTDDDAAYAEAFDDLSDSRPSGFGPGAIPITEMAAWFDRLGWGDFETFFKRIRACDRAFLQFHADKQSPAN